MKEMTLVRILRLTHGLQSVDLGNGPLPSAAPDGLTINASRSAEGLHWQYRRCQLMPREQRRSNRVPRDGMGLAEDTLVHPATSVSVVLLTKHCDCCLLRYVSRCFTEFRLANLHCFLPK